MSGEFKGSGARVDLGALPPPRKVRMVRKSVAAQASDEVVRHGNKTALREAQGRSTSKGKKAPRKDRVKEGNEKALAEHHRAKPTAEQIARGVFATVEAEKFDTARLGEKVLINLAARGRGAATMFARGQIKAREFKAAEKICELAELAGMSQLSGLPLSERVDGGKVDLSGSRLTAAAWAASDYREALEQISRTGRSLVENVIVRGISMEEAVNLRSIAARVGEISSRKRCEKASVLLAEALDHLADVFKIKRA